MVSDKEEEGLDFLANCVNFVARYYFLYGSPSMIELRYFVKIFFLHFLKHTIYLLKINI